jgi:hypothetical protein
LKERMDKMQHVTELNYKSYDDLVEEIFVRHLGCRNTLFLRHLGSHLEELTGKQFQFPDHIHHTAARFSPGEYQKYQMII